MQILDFFKKEFSRDNIKSLVMCVIVLTVILYSAYIIGQHKPIFLAILLIIPTSVYFYMDELDTVKKVYELRQWTLGLCVVIAFFVSYQFSHYESYLDKSFVNGKIHSITIEIEDDGRPSTKEEKSFTPYNNSDNYKIDIIFYTLLFVNLGSPILTWWVTKKKIDKLKKTISEDLINNIGN